MDRAHSCHISSQTAGYKSLCTSGWSWVLDTLVLWTFVLFFLNRSTLRPVEMAYWVKYSGSELMNGLFWVKYSALWGGLTDIRRGEPECARHHQNWNFPLRCQCILFPNEIAILSRDQNRKVWKLFYSILETAALSSLYFTYILSFPYSTVLIGNLCFPVALFPKREAGFP